MKIAIYDIESAGAITEWSSIIEIGGVLIDENFKEIDRFNLRGRIPEGEIPQAKALLVNGTTIDQLTNRVFLVNGSWVQALPQATNFAKHEIRKSQKQAMSSNKRKH